MCHAHQIATNALNRATEDAKDISALARAVVDLTNRVAALEGGRKLPYPDPTDDDAAYLQAGRLKQ